MLDLFDTLNTPVDKRDPYLDDDLKKFPFVNGGLFAGKIEIPNFTPEIRDLLLDEASSGFNWAGISPTIFGAVFESTLNPETRRAGGMHYTSIENIHKVIDPLFLDDLREEFSRIKTRKKLLEFRDKLAAIKIFDPACGSGNFLTESFLSLRRLENETLKQIFGAQIQLGDIVDPVKVSIANFYGIEINDFAVAQTALWIAELQMLAETAEIVHKKLDARRSRLTRTFTRTTRSNSTGTKFVRPTSTSSSATRRSSAKVFSCRHKNPTWQKFSTASRASATSIMSRAGINLPLII